MSAADVASDDHRTLSEMFAEAIDMVHKIDQSQLETNSAEYQNEVKSAIKLLERCTDQVNQLQLFSTNEHIKEVATSEIQFMLLPAFLGYLTLKQSDPDRAEVLRLARIYLRDFIKRLNAYEVIKVPLDESDDEDEQHEGKAKAAASSLEDMARKRNEKVLRFKTLKQMESLLDTMKQGIDSKSASVDDEYLRKYETIRLRRWVLLIQDELDSMELEFQMVNRRPVPERSEPARKPMKPFMITRDALQKQVFGLGYPSRPVMTVDEFVDQKMQDGSWAFNNKQVYDNSLQNWAQDPDKKAHEDENHEARKERLLDQDDEEELQRARQWDEFKDDTKRGSGNRKNMG